MQLFAVFSNSVRNGKEHDVDVAAETDNVHSSEQPNSMKHVEKGLNKVWHKMLSNDDKRSRAGRHSMRRAIDDENEAIRRCENSIPAAESEKTNDEFE